ncbi:ABC transporter ATP-binding protein [Allostreptomyces psammosilenae]|uniref:ABC-type Mn2+/Zn2+ transport system ATPase subunit n=1 Tax=Allostreptomyces psammosilenae TaxID=1892865 RepID=A0A852ZNK6_9ACTN|nr:ATP-binding cassette domain-containing protein [Allostreptomyces psammosilenae]NYI03255.1 ABC-type Mn2+/Zn2+ transport system ATPase subunit [Allostreptomyces psammosilenae]
MSKGTARHTGGGLRLEDVGKRYRAGGPWVLRGVDLRLEPGTLARIEGANGGGKSTLLKLIAGVEAPSRGRLLPLTGGHGRPSTCYVPERFAPALPFDATGYLTHLGSVHGLRRREAARRAAHWLERLGLADQATVPLRHLSKGSCQKVAVTQALMAEPGLLVLDEAWTGLDEPSRTLLDDAVRERVAAGGIVVFVDHDPRRLAGEVTSRHAVRDGTVVPVAPVLPVEHEDTDAGKPAGRTALRVTIEVTAPEAELDAALHTVGAAGVVTRPAGGEARVELAAEHSDAVLRRLLGAAPSLHVRSVRETEAGPSGRAQRAGEGGSR